MKPVKSIMARLIAGLVLTIGAAYIGAHVPAGPHCPTEDSCAADYHHGAWHITEVKP